MTSLPVGRKISGALFQDCFAGSGKRLRCCDHFVARAYGQSSPATQAASRPSGFSLGQLISRNRRACAANQPIRLFQNVGICRLFSRKKADHHERRAKQQAYEHHLPVSASIRTVKRTRHKSPLTQRRPELVIACGHFRTIAQRWENGFVAIPPPPDSRSGGHALFRTAGPQPNPHQRPS